MGARQKIPQEELDRIKRDVSVADLAARRGVKLAPHGKDLIGLCPFHFDREPSLVITPEKNLWHCLGACGVGGDVIAWVMKAEGVSFRHAVELLRRHDVGLASVRTTPASARNLHARKLPPPFEPDAEDHDVLRRVAEFYHETLKDTQEALAYLEKRRIGHRGAVDQFKLGYANRTLGYRLPFSQVQAGRDIRVRLMNLGIYRKSGHEHLTGSVVIPLMNEQGVVTGMYGRKITPRLREGTPLHLYLPGPHRGVWNVSAFAASNEVILCESLIDALTFWCAGYANVTASYGVEGFTADHLAAFKKYKIEKILLAYDRDDAGDRAAAKLAPALMENGFDVFRVEFPEGLDANDYARMVDDPADTLGQILRAAAWIGKGKRETKAPPPASATKEKDGDNGSSADSPPVPCESFPLAADAPAPVEALTPAAPVPDLPLCEPPEAIEQPEAAAITASNDADSKPVDEVFDGRAWRIRGWEKNTAYGVLKVNVRVAVGDRFHMDTVDLANARLRGYFLKSSSVETGLSENILKDDLRRLLLKLEEMQDVLIQRRLKPRDPVVQMSETERAEALAFLKSPDLLKQIVKDFESVGIVGESVNVLTGYLACVSRKFDDPLAVIIQSSSAAGKSAIMDAVLSLMPEEEREKFTAVTGQALFYMEETNLKHKIIAIVEEQGAEKATYALKLLQSEGKLKIAATGKDPLTGKLVTRVYTVEGPVVIFITTTNVDIEEELLNRVLVLTVNEDRDQTRRIHEIQRHKETLDGVLRRERRGEIARRHQNAQRLLRPLRVVNPYADRLTFLDTHLRARRDHPKYLTLIRSIALLHQYRRPVKQTSVGGRVVSYIEVAPSDIEAANRIADAVMGRSLDELPPQTHRLLMLIDDMVTARCEELRVTRAAFRFTRRDARQFTGWTDFQIKIHMRKLEDYEYLLAHRGARGVSFVYELLYDGKGKLGEPFCMGLIDPATLNASETSDYDANLEGSNGQKEHEKGKLEGSSSPKVASKLTGSRSRNFAAILKASKASRALMRNWAKTQVLRPARPTSS